MRGLISKKKAYPYLSITWSVKRVSDNNNCSHESMFVGARTCLCIAANNRLLCIWNDQQQRWKEKMAQYLKNWKHLFFTVFSFFNNRWLYCFRLEAVRTSWYQFYKVPVYVNILGKPPNSKIRKLSRKSCL